MAGPQTAFGDALGLAINVFDRSDATERVLIALTDGNDTSSKVPPVKAAEIAKDKGIVIYTVAVGDPRAAGDSMRRPSGPLRTPQAAFTPSLQTRNNWTLFTSGLTRCKRTRHRS